MAAMPKPVLTIKRIEHFGDARDDKISTELNKTRREEAEFFSELKHLEIKFDFEKGTPLQNGDTFLVNAGQITHTGPLKENVREGVYPYSVKAQGLGAGTDPQIIVTN